MCLLVAGRLQIAEDVRWDPVQRLEVLGRNGQKHAETRKRSFISLEPRKCLSTCKENAKRYRGSALGRASQPSSESQSDPLLRRFTQTQGGSRGAAFP